MSNFESGPARSNTDKVLRWEDAAKRVTVEGWSCAECGQFYGNTDHAEHMARYCCHTDAPCGTEGCTNRKERHRVQCDACYHKAKVLRYATEIEKAEDRRAPSNECPLSMLTGDTYFFDLDDLLEYCEEHEKKPSDLFLIYCHPHDPGAFSLVDHLSDYMPEDYCHLPDPDAARLAEDAVNRYLDANRPFSWYPDYKRRPTDEMLAEWDAQYAKDHP